MLVMVVFFIAFRWIRASKITCRRSDVMSKGKKRSGARPGRPQPLRGTRGKRKGSYYVHPVNIQTACLIMEGAEFTENIINGVERPVKAAELFAFTLRVRAGNTDLLTDADAYVTQ